jgi:hypothetical protein
MAKIKKTFSQRTLELLTVKLALESGYGAHSRNLWNIRHFSFIHPSLPDVDVSWYRGADEASVTVGDTTTNDSHAEEILREALTTQ